MPEPIELRVPRASDGKPLFDLVMGCPPLDVNSVYCNLLQCSHFAATSVAASQGDSLAGFTSAYIIPGRPDTLFVWQVAVGEQARGQGLAKRMLENILSRPCTAEVKFLETSITEDNQASWALFNSLAKQRKTTLQQSVMFDKQQHFNGQHDTEMLVSIGPF
jgi:L-2,4-diaminobutyric acid acetyltransferase